MLLFCVRFAVWAMLSVVCLYDVCFAAHRSVRPERHLKWSSNILKPEPLVYPLPPSPPQAPSKRVCNSPLPAFWPRVVGSHPHLLWGFGGGGTKSQASKPKSISDVSSSMFHRTKGFHQGVVPVQKFHSFRPFFRSRKQVVFQSFDSVNNFSRIVTQSFRAGTCHQSIVPPSPKPPVRLHSFILTDLLAFSWLRAVGGWVIVPRMSKPQICLVQPTIKHPLIRCVCVLLCLSVVCMCHFGCVYICIYICIYMYIYRCVCVCECVCFYTGKHVCKYIYIYLCMCMHVCMCIECCVCI